MRRPFIQLSAVYDKYGALIFGVITLGLAVFILFWGQPIGLSDNGDFKRVMDASSLQLSSPGEAFTYTGTYTIVLTENTAMGNIFKILFSPEGISNYPSLQIPLVRISVILNLAVNKVIGNDMTVYRLEALGAMYSVLYACVIGFLFAQFHLPKRITDIIAKSVILIVLGDVGYLTYFNSFYGEALQLIAFIFLAAMLVRILLHRPRWPDSLLSAFGCIVFGWSKFFNIPAACVFALLLFGLILIRSTHKAIAVVGFVPLFVLAAIFFSIPSWMSLQTKYNAIYFGALRETSPSSCRQYLKELALSAELIKYRNTHIYVDGIAVDLEKNGYVKDILNVSSSDITEFYLKHPDRLLSVANITLQNAGSIRPYYLSNLGGNAPRLTFSHRFAFWSDLRTSLGFDSLAGFIGVVCLFELTVITLLWRAGRKWYELLLVFSLPPVILVYFFIAPVLSNGEADLAKHLFAYAHMIDAMVLFVLTCALYELSMKKFRFSSACCLILVLCLVYSPLKTGISRLASANKTHTGFDVGTFVSFGRYLENDIIWQVAAENDGILTLMCADIIDKEPFSFDKHNAWTSSSIRRWLNTVFLSDFSPRDRERIKPFVNTVLLSRDSKTAATSGNRDFFFSPIASLSARGYREAYSINLQDLVTLPDIDLISKLDQANFKFGLNDIYWLETPYFNNGYMARCIMSDGSILMREVNEPAGVLPVIHIEAPDRITGKGSYSDPFEFN